ncbi:hypothetical protein FHX08_005050 [Rhizobium sp. BK529]|uniref:hypothetical protein n=1 Tax=Rhizobium sp. BK529 TaxID=2586983 RepID=UPI00160CB49B|nr:hypothetical protein [Rhizobium sp. BK529]
MDREEDWAERNFAAGTAGCEAAWKACGAALSCRQFTSIAWKSNSPRLITDAIPPCEHDKNISEAAVKHPQRQMRNIFNKLILSENSVFGLR